MRNRLWHLHRKLKIRRSALRPALPCLGHVRPMKARVDLNAIETPGIAFKVRSFGWEQRSVLFRNRPTSGANTDDFYSSRRTCVILHSVVMRQRAAGCRHLSAKIAEERTLAQTLPVTRYCPRIALGRTSAAECLSSVVRYPPPPHGCRCGWRADGLRSKG